MGDGAPWIWNVVTDRWSGAHQFRDNQPTLLQTAQQLLPADLPLCTGEDPLPRRTHHTLDVTHREDESRVRHPGATSVLGIFRRLSNALKQARAKGRPKRGATSRDWIEENHFNRWRGIRLFMRQNPI